MDDERWEMFFCLLREIVDMRQAAWYEKLDAVWEQARKHRGEEDLQEFVGWFCEQGGG